MWCYDWGFKILENLLVFVWKGNVIDEVDILLLVVIGKGLVFMFSCSFVFIQLVFGIVLVLEFRVILEGFFFIVLVLFLGLVKFQMFLGFCSFGFLVQLQSCQCEYKLVVFYVKQQGDIVVVVRYFCVVKSFDVVLEVLSWGEFVDFFCLLLLFDQLFLDLLLLLLQFLIFVMVFFILEVFLFLRILLEVLEQWMEWYQVVVVQVKSKGDQWKV